MDKKLILSDRILPGYRKPEELAVLMKKNILISFPRSGNTAIRLFLEKYTNKPTGRPLLINGMSIGTNTASSILFHDIPLAVSLDRGPILTKIHKFWEVDLL